jgi:hypothetical protein
MPGENAIPAWPHVTHGRVPVPAPLLPVAGGDETGPIERMGALAA